MVLDKQLSSTCNRDRRLHLFYFTQLFGELRNLAKSSKVEAYFFEICQIVTLYQGLKIEG